MNAEQKKLVCLLQEEFPLCERPFAQIARELGTSEENVIRMTKEMHEKGMLRRIGVSLFHTRAGYKINSMVAWDVPEEQLDQIADEVSRLQQVSHCYVREKRPEFDYNFYTMVHETSEERFDQLLKQLEEIIRPVKFCSLRTIRELKKTGMKYYTEG